jgi:hypothetical protein
MRTSLQEIQKDRKTDRDTKTFWNWSLSESTNKVRKALVNNTQDIASFEFAGVACVGKIH